MICVRPATAADFPFILSLRNEPEAARLSTRGRAVTHDEYWAELGPALGGHQAACRVYIVIETNGAAIGYVRFDVRSTGVEVGIAVSPAVRGRGIGREALQRGCELAREQFGAQKFHAIIRHENIASQKIFQAVGFVSVRRDEHFGYYEL